MPLALHNFSLSFFLQATDVLYSFFLDFCRRRGLDEDPDDNTKMKEVDEMNDHEEQK